MEAPRFRYRNMGSFYELPNRTGGDAGPSVSVLHTIPALHAAVQAKINGQGAIRILRPRGA